MAASSPLPPAFSSGANYLGRGSVFLSAEACLALCKVKRAIFTQPLMDAVSAEVLLPFGVLRRARLPKPIYIHTHIRFEFSSPPIFLSSLLLSPSLSPCLPQC